MQFGSGVGAQQPYGGQGSPAYPQQAQFGQDHYGPYTQLTAPPPMSGSFPQPGSTGGVAMMAQPTPQYPMTSPFGTSGAYGHQPPQIQQPSYGAQPTTTYGAQPSTSYVRPQVMPTTATMMPKADPLADVNACNAFPCFAQPTLGKCPSSSSAKQKLGAPLGVCFIPLATPPEDAPEISTINYGTRNKIVRCAKCRTYINPFVVWESGGRRWKCNLCHMTNDTPPSYVASVDETGRRVDRFERPELSQGSVEFIAPADYMVRPPMAPTFIILLDVSASAVASGLVASACHAARATLEQMPQTRVQIVVITFDSTMHFYNLDKNLKAPQMMVVPDLEDVYVPLAGDVFSSLEEHKDAILELLDTIPHMWRSQKINDCCLGSAVKAAYAAAKHNGGKILLFTSSCPNLGEFTVDINRSKMARDAKKSNEEHQMSLTRAAVDNYYQLAQILTQNQLACDLFVCPSGETSALDLATWAPLATSTGGQIHYMSGFSAHTHSEQLHSLAYRALTQDYAWEAVMRIRVSRGWKIANWLGHFHKRGSDLLVLPAGSQDQAFTVHLELEESVATDPVLYVQAALLYTSSNSERRIRVHTLAVPVTQIFQEVVDSIRVKPFLSMIAQQAISIAQRSKLSDGRTYLQNVLGQAIAALGAASPDVASEIMKHLPRSVLGLMKSGAFRESVDISTDLRVYLWNRLLSLPPELVQVYCYPQLISIKDHSEGFQSITPLPLTASSMSQDSAYVLEDGETIMMWIGKLVSAEWLYRVFGVQSLEKLSPEVAPSMLGGTGDPLGIALASLITRLRNERQPGAMRVTVLRQGDPMEYKFFMALVEDRIHSLPLSLQEFMQKVSTGAAAGAAPRGMQPAPPPATAYSGMVTSSQTVGNTQTGVPPNQMYANATYGGAQGRPPPTYTATQSSGQYPTGEPNASHQPYPPTGGHPPRYY